MTDLRRVGSSVSPYTRKVRALLRYRRIPYQFVRAGGRESEALPSAPLPLIPYVVLPDQNGELTEAMVDTTPIIDRLEDDYPERAVRPMDPALAVIDALLEEFGDEWLAKCLTWLKQRYNHRNTPPRISTETVNFRRAFVRWNGMTPREYRQRHLSETDSPGIMAPV